MTQTQEITKTFAATVKELGKDSNGLKATLDIPSLGKFPVDLNRIPEADYKQLEVGKSYNLLLGRGKLKEKEPAYDGKMDWMYFWNWRGFAVFEATDETELPVSEKGYHDPTRDSIERQKALDIAERMYWNWWDRAGSKLPDSPSLMSEHLKRIKSVAVGLTQFLMTGKASQEVEKK